MSTTLHTEIVNDLLKLAVESGASDIVIKSEKPGYLRMGGRLRPVEMDPITCTVKIAGRFGRPIYGNSHRCSVIFAWRTEQGGCQANLPKKVSVD